MNAATRKILTTATTMPSLSMAMRGVVRLPAVSIAVASRTTAAASAAPYHSYRGSSHGPIEPRHSTTIVCVRKNGKVCMMADGMVSQGNLIIKPNVVKIRRILPKGMDVEEEEETTTTSSSEGEEKKEPKLKKGTIVGFAGSTADAFTLLERLEGKLDEYPGQLARSCVELAKGWRTDKYLRRLEASLIVADENISLEITGNGDVLESHDGILGVGSGSPYAIAAARALKDFPDLSAEDVARRAMTIAADMCVYTNHNFLSETIQAKEASKEGDDGTSVKLL